MSERLLADSLRMPCSPAEKKHTVTIECTVDVFHHCKTVIVLTDHLSKYSVDCATLTVFTICDML